MVSKPQTSWDCPFLGALCSVAFQKNKLDLRLDGSLFVQAIKSLPCRFIPGPNFPASMESSEVWKGAAEYSSEKQMVE